jgi:hypothetical protein
MDKKVTEWRAGKAATCSRCRTPMTWAAQKRQYGRLLRHGLSQDAVKGSSMPRCQKCVTLIFKDLGQLTQARQICEISGISEPPLSF